MPPKKANAKNARKNKGAANSLRWFSDWRMRRNFGDVQLLKALRDMINSRYAVRSVAANRTPNNSLMRAIRQARARRGSLY